MRSRGICSNFGSCGLLCAVILGCSAAKEPTIPVITPTVEQSSVSPIPERTDAEQVIEQKVEQTSDVEDSSQPKSDGIESLAYEPPFPDREDPFQAPLRNSNVNSGQVGNFTDEIQLLGFANVRGQKAILSINGMVVPIGEGGLESGIEVISIQPPAVVLQRNNQRWQTSLEY